MFDPNSKSIVWGLSPFMLAIGIVYHVISFAFPHWLENDECHVGLWQRICSQSETFNSTALSKTMDTISPWYHATQILQCFALVCVIACLTTGLLRVNHGHLKWQWLCALAALLAGLLSLIGCAVFAFSKPRPSALHLSWAFVFNVVSGFLCLLASPILYLDTWWRR